MFNFVPDSPNGVPVPYIEDARADFAPYYSSHQNFTEEDAQQKVRIEIAKLHAGVTRFVPGYFGNNPKRYGYEIEFNMGGAPGIIKVAGLPIRANPTDKKKRIVRIQALLNVRDWLKAAVTAQIFSPGNLVLMQFLLVDGRQTMGEWVVAQKKLPDFSGTQELLHE